MNIKLVDQDPVNLKALLEQYIYQMSDDEAWSDDADRFDLAEKLLKQLEKY